MQTPGQVRTAYLVVAVGAVIGALARSFFDLVAALAWGNAALTILVVNLAGSAALGLVLVWGERAFIASHRFHHYWRPFAATGLLGGFTTTSAYALHTFALAQGQLAAAAAYIAASLIGGYAAYAAAHTWALRRLQGAA